jgi:hypothetical protein
LLARRDPGFRQRGAEVAGVGAAALYRWQCPAFSGRRLFGLEARGIAAAARTGWSGLGRRQVALQAFVAPASNQQLDRKPAENNPQPDDGFVPIGKKQVAERREEVLKAAHA